MSGTSRLSVAILLLVQSLAPLVPALAAGHTAPLLKWVDEQGRVHYGDTIPSEQLKHERKELSKHGIELRTVEPPKTKTEQQLLEESRAKERAEEEARQRAERAHQDQILFESFNSAEDIIATRDRRLSALEAEIRVAEAFIAKLEQQLEHQIANAANMERSGRPVTDKDRSDIAATRRQIADSQNFIKLKQREQKEVTKTFEQALTRYRELPANRPLSPESGSPRPRP